MKNYSDLAGSYPPRLRPWSTLFDLHNSSYPTQRHSIFANYDVVMNISFYVYWPLKQVQKNMPDQILENSDSPPNIWRIHLYILTFCHTIFSNKYVLKKILVADSIQLFWLNVVNFALEHANKKWLEERFLIMGSSVYVLIIYLYLWLRTDAKLRNECKPWNAWHCHPGKIVVQKLTFGSAFVNKLGNALITFSCCLKVMLCFREYTSSTETEVYSKTSREILCLVKQPPLLYRVYT